MIIVFKINDKINHRIKEKAKEKQLLSLKQNTVLPLMAKRF